MTNEEIIIFLLGERKDIKGSLLLRQLLQNEEYKKLVENGIKNESIYPLLTDKLMDEMEYQNCRCYSSLKDIFIDGKNIGTCNQTSTELSYMMNDVDLVGGHNKFFIGTSASVDGVHSWIEDSKYVYDTSTLMIVDKKYISDLDYVEDKRYTSYNLAQNQLYQSAKEFACDRSLNTHKK